LWDSADVSKEERKFLLKVFCFLPSLRGCPVLTIHFYSQLDFTLLTFGTLGMLIKWVRNTPYLLRTLVDILHLD
jgi:ACS family pantothenate transporter-like MFS transporter